MPVWPLPPLPLLCHLSHALPLIFSFSSTFRCTFTFISLSSHPRSSFSLIHLIFIIFIRINSLSLNLLYLFFMQFPPPHLHHLLPSHLWMCSLCLIALDRHHLIVDDGQVCYLHVWWHIMWQNKEVSVISPPPGWQILAGFRQTQKNSSARVFANLRQKTLF